MNPRLMRFVLAVFGGAALAISIPADAQEDARNVIPYRDEQPARAIHGMVVSVHHLAADAGVEVLREGGNAVDAAVATGFALAVVHPAAGNLGGGGFLLLRTHDGHATFIDFREKAPLAATETMYQDAHGEVIPDASVIGYRSIATPGSVAGLVYAERKYGSQRALRSRSGALPRLETHLSARRPALQSWRSFQAAGACAHARTDRRRSGRLLPRKDGA
jgi:gamma-glutamyltranspeptidase/glutathione hydrolase